MIDHIFVAPKTAGVSETQFPLPELVDTIHFAAERQLDLELSAHLLTDVSACQAALAQFDGILAIYGPSTDLNPVSADEEIAALSRQRYVQTIQLAKQLNARYVIFRSQDTPLQQVNQHYKNWLGKTTTFWEKMIADLVEGSPLTVLLENYQDPTPETLKTLLSRIASSHLKASLDVGHVNLFSDTVAMDWLEALGSSVAYVQLHNNNGELDEHLGLENGTIDMGTLLNHLALLNQKIHVGLACSTLADLVDSHHQLLPFLQLQQAQFSSKSFLV